MLSNDNNWPSDRHYHLLGERQHYIHAKSIALTFNVGIGLVTHKPIHIMVYFPDRASAHVYIFWSVRNETTDTLAVK